MSNIKRSGFISFITLALGVGTVVLVLQPAARGVHAAVREDPLVGIHFGIEADGLSGFFTSCHGMGSTQEVIEHKVIGGDGIETVRKVPGRLQYNDVICTRGMTSNIDLPNWRALVESGNIEEARKNITLTAFDQQLTPVASWAIVAAWPSEYRVVGALEVVRIVSEGISRSE